MKINELSFENHLKRIERNFLKNQENESLIQYFCEELCALLGADEALFFLLKSLKNGDLIAKKITQTCGKTEFNRAVRIPANNTHLIAELKRNPLTHSDSSEISTFYQEKSNSNEPPRPVYLISVHGRKRLKALFLIINPHLSEEQLTAFKKKWRSLARFPRLVVSKLKIESKKHREALELNALLHLAQKMSASLNLERVLQSVVDSLRNVVPYDNAVIFLVNRRTKDIEYQLTRGYSEIAKEKLHLKFGQGITGWVAKTGKSVITPDVSKELRYIKADERVRSEIAVPIRTGKKVIGVFTLGSFRVNAFTVHQKKLLEAFAGHAAIAIQNARLHRLSIKKKELENDLEVARKIQIALLRRNLPQSEQFNLAAYNAPSKHVGGDLYDVIQLANGRIALSVADVAGKGVPGAILMATLHAIYRAQIRLHLEADQLMALINAEFKENIEVGSFATFFHATISPDYKNIEYCSAGHNPAILLKKDKSVEILEATSIILGLTENIPFVKKIVAFEPGDVLVAYSDGVTEAENEKESMFGLNRLKKAVLKGQNSDAKGMIDTILQELRKFCHQTIHQDDITIVVAKYKET